MSDPADSLECYLVGGAVRDELLGLPPGDRDWVVVGATPPQMGDLGFTPVGVDFPVFLHPHSHEEYALARTERKSAPGYRGFTIHADQDVTLEQDLARRDLTINAIARRADGTLIDPFDGQADIASRTLRHVSPAFAEDPVRLLRVARFATRFNAQNFCVADETLALMADLVRNGEVNALVAERVWAETRRALDDARPSVFFDVLRSCGALAVLFPEIDALFGVPQRARYHPEIDTGVHVMMALDMAAQLGASNRTRFAVLLHDLGKALTPEDVLPAHIGHEGRGVKPVRAMSARLKVPSDYRDLAVLVCENHLKMHQLMQLRPSTINKLLNSLGAFRQNSNVDDFALACECDARGRKGLEHKNYPQRGQLRHFARAASEISAAAIQSERVSFGHEPLQGPAIGAAMEKERCRAIERIKNEFSNESENNT